MVNEKYAFITCVCGQKFQVLNVDGEDWDEVATALKYTKHLPKCKGMV